MGSILRKTQHEEDARLISQVWVHREVDLDVSIFKASILSITKSGEELPN